MNTKKYKHEHKQNTNITKNKSSPKCASNIDKRLIPFISFFGWKICVKILLHESVNHKNKIAQFFKNRNVFILWADKLEPIYIHCKSRYCTLFPSVLHY